MNVFDRSVWFRAEIVLQGVYQGCFFNVHSDMRVCINKLDWAGGSCRWQGLAGCDSRVQAGYELPAGPLSVVGCIVKRLAAIWHGSGHCQPGGGACLGCFLAKHGEGRLGRRLGRW